MALANIFREMNLNRNVIIAGGGLAGLICGIILGKKGFKPLLIEKKTYPFNKVCGEYLSNEVKPFLTRLGVNFDELNPANINKLRISSPSGFTLYSDLLMGGMGISRFSLDNYLFKLAIENGCEVLSGTEMNKISFLENRFEVKLSNNTYLTTPFVIGSFGKRSILDRDLKRKFLNQRTGYMAVKYHVKTDYPVNEIGLDNFENGYCGIVKVDKDIHSLCYLTKNSNLKKHQTIEQMEKIVLFQNPRIKNIFSNAEFIHEKPLVINEITFHQKDLISDHVIMCGDAAGTITPLCGNGMSIAIHSAKLLCELMCEFKLDIINDLTISQRITFEDAYIKTWNQNFKSRLKWGRGVQSIFGNKTLTNCAFHVLNQSSHIRNWLISKSHGRIVC